MPLWTIASSKAVSVCAMLKGLGLLQIEVQPVVEQYSSMPGIIVYAADLFP